MLSQSKSVCNELALIYFCGSKPLKPLKKALTLKWSRYCVLPLVVKRGPMDPNSENAFSEGIF